MKKYLKKVFFVTSLIVGQIILSLLIFSFLISGKTVKHIEVYGKTISVESVNEVLEAVNKTLPTDIKINILNQDSKIIAQKKLNLKDIGASYIPKNELNDIKKDFNKGKFSKIIDTVSGKKEDNNVIETERIYYNENLLKNWLIENINQYSVMAQKDAIVVKNKMVGYAKGYPGISIDLEGLFKEIDKSLRNANTAQIDFKADIVNPNTDNSVEQLSKKFKTVLSVQKVPSAYSLSYQNYLLEMTEKLNNTVIAPKGVVDFNSMLLKAYPDIFKGKNFTKNSEKQSAIETLITMIYNNALNCNLADISFQDSQVSVGKEKFEEPIGLKFTNNTKKEILMIMYVENGEFYQIFLTT